MESEDIGRGHGGKGTESYTPLLLLVEHNLHAFRANATAQAVVPTAQAPTQPRTVLIFAISK